MVIVLGEVQGKAQCSQNRAKQVIIQFCRNGPDESRSPRGCISNENLVIVIIVMIMIMIILMIIMTIKMMIHVKRIYSDNNDIPDNILFFQSY